MAMPAREPAEPLQQALAELEERMATRTEELLQATARLREEMDARTRAEAALRVSEEKYRSMVDDISDCLWEIDGEGHFSFLNARTFSLLGYLPEEMLGKSPFDFMPAEEAPIAAAKFAAHAAQCEPLVLMENVFLHKDGHRVITETSGRPIFDANSTRCGYRGIARDMTAHKLAETALRISEERFRTLATAAPVGIFLTDREGNCIFVNERWCRMAGVTVTEALGCGWSDTLHPEDRECVLASWHAMVRKGEATSLECRLRKPDGTITWVIGQSVPLRDDSRQITQYLTTVMDITDRKIAEADREKLHAITERHMAELNATMEAMADGLIVFAPDEHIIYMNHAVEEIYGISETEQLRLASLNERVEFFRQETATGKAFPVAEHPAGRALRGETVRSQIMALHRPDGRKIWLSASAAPIRLPDGESLGAVLVFTDVSRLHELQEQHEAYLHSISHDLRAPLTIMQGHAQMLREDLSRLDAGEEHCFKVEAILRAARSMNMMIQDLVDAARLEAGQLQLHRQPIAMRAYIESLLARSVIAFDTDRITLNIPDDLPPVFADPERLERILLNLLSNAVKYSTPGSPIWLYAVHSGSQVLIYVRDIGPGVPAHDLPHIFERFYRAGGIQAEGIGLGLYITKMLVEAHQGCIDVISKPGKGSTFQFTLPAAK